ncbi:ATP-binding protein [Rhodocyclus tenuis]|uniref:Signal transduction histidine kinase n=1 Tax=Rhodocyclus tenuis TaxID=1066 RepID=A0A840GED6_RHOTE|nr:HAMP domain-containing histidine kinase [Rhodocyclus tenuis]MBB4246922.1 signal transduction histidine kinase [Rhodocyclus tenuis]
MNSFAAIGEFLMRRQRWVLIALLALLHVTLVNGVSSLGLTAWMVDVGLFILWQPFIRAQRKLGVVGIALLVGGLAVGALFFGWWLLICWCLVLAALVGGRVMFTEHRLTRVFYLLAFSYLLLALLLWLLPRVAPDGLRVDHVLEVIFIWGSSLVFLLMGLLPDDPESAAGGPAVVDFFYSLFIFLLLAVLMFGSLAFMFLRQAGYVESLIYALIGLAAMLLLIGWAWNPRPGFSGVGMVFSRYLLTVGLPFEKWLHRLTAEAEGEADPERFVGKALAAMAELPWVEGGSWRTARSAGEFGTQSRHCQNFRSPPLALALYTRYPLSPALVWHFHLLVQLAAEYYQARLRARELQHLSYLRAVHETGARLTHDVKNLLQSLNNLCYLAQNSGGSDAAELNQLLLRQLPQISQRLRQTLDKLQKPQNASLETQPAAQWWENLQQRYAGGAIDFSPSPLAADASVPAALFDSVVDNLLQNALDKRQHESALRIAVALAADGEVLAVADDGSPLPAALLADLLRAPVASENGLGIGLYHAAQQAAVAGFALALVSNRHGDVRFELRRNQL